MYLRKCRVMRMQMQINANTNIMKCLMFQLTCGNISFSYHTYSVQKYDFFQTSEERVCSTYDGLCRVSGLRRDPAVCVEDLRILARGSDTQICVRSYTKTAGSLRNLETRRTPSLYMSTPSEQISGGL